MKGTELRNLQRLARLLGIQTEYQSDRGEWRVASADTLKALVGLWDLPNETDKDIEEAVEIRRLQLWDVGLPSVAVAWNGRIDHVELRLPAARRHQPTHCSLLLENGQRHEWNCVPGAHKPLRRHRLRGVEHHAYGIPLLNQLPTGYHRLEIQTSDRRFKTLIISAPTRSFENPMNTREWGVFAPLYSLRSKRNWGAGDLTDWMALMDFVGQQGGSIVGSLPILASFLDQPFEPSPYSPASRLFWNEFYLDIEKVVGFSESEKAKKLVKSPGFQKELKKLKATAHVDYAGVMAAKRKVLKILSAEFFNAGGHRRTDYLSHLQRHRHTEDYARFRAVGDKLQTGWPVWPEPLRSGKIKPDDFERSDEQYHLFVQWQCEIQLHQVTEYGKQTKVQFYLDLPLGVNPDSYDVWRYRQLFARGCSAGAPPDCFFTKGQNWGFSPLHPDRLRESHYDYLARLLRFQMRHTGLLRIDHVMGLHRLFWIPPGAEPRDGAYVSYPAEEWHAILNVESHRHQTRLVGENLGTVPREVERGMERHGLRKMYVAQYTMNESRQPLALPMKETVASINTHDMPMFAAFWSGADIQDREDLGLLQRQELPKVSREREKVKKAVFHFLKKNKAIAAKARFTAENTLQGLLIYLGRSPSEIVLATLEDLWLETKSQNVPGTHRERPNWKRKNQLTMDQFRTDAAVLHFLQQLQESRNRPLKKKTP